MSEKPYLFVVNESMVVRREFVVYAEHAPAAKWKMHERSMEHPQDRVHKLPSSKGIGTKIEVESVVEITVDTALDLIAPLPSITPPGAEPPPDLLLCTDDAWRALGCGCRMDACADGVIFTFCAPHRNAVTQ